MCGCGVVFGGEGLGLNTALLLLTPLPNRERVLSSWHPFQTDIIMSCTENNIEHDGSDLKPLTTWGGTRVRLAGAAAVAFLPDFEESTTLLFRRRQDGSSFLGCDSRAVITVVHRKH